MKPCGALSDCMGPEHTAEGGLFGCLETFWLSQLGMGRPMGLLAASGSRPEMLLNALQCTGQTHNKDPSDPKVQLCPVEKSCFRQ